MYEYTCPTCGQHFGMPDAARAHRGYELDKWTLRKLHERIAKLNEQAEDIAVRINEYEYNAQKEPA